MELQFFVDIQVPEAGEKEGKKGEKLEVPMSSFWWGLIWDFKEKITFNFVDIGEF